MTLVFNSKVAVLISVSIFVIQIFILTVLSSIYPPAQFRTGLFHGITYLGSESPGFLVDSRSYFDLLALPVAVFLKTKLSSKWNFFMQNKKEQIVEEKKFSDLEKEWRRIFDLRIPLLITFPLYLVLLVMWFHYGGLSEPIEITITWTLDDFLGIFASVWSFYSGLRISRFLVKKIATPDIMKSIDIYERMGGWKEISSVASFVSLLVGLTNGIWLVPWLMFGIVEVPSLALDPIQLALIKIEISVIVISIVSPIIFFTYISKSLAERICIIKLTMVKEIKTTLEEIHRKIMKSPIGSNSELVNLKENADYLSARIDRVQAIKEWSLDAKNIILLVIPIILQLTEVFSALFLVK